MLRRAGSDVSVWGQEAAQRYAVAKHGPDGARFLDGYLYPLLGGDRMYGMDFLDLGAGTGPWSQFARGQGAKTVTAVDLNPAMLAQARQRLWVNGRLPPNVRVERMDVANLKLPDQSFDRLASINVGCNLPVDAFIAHFREAFRVARRGARFVVAAPNSLLVPFTNSKEATDIQGEVDRLWVREAVHDAAAVKRVIDQLRTVLRATFVLDSNGKPVLVTPENAHLVQEGTPIVRRIPGLVVDNNYHTVEAYIQQADGSGWEIHAMHQESFPSQWALADHNVHNSPENRLGPAYIGHPPFLVMDLEKVE